MYLLATFGFVFVVGVNKAISHSFLHIRNALLEKKLIFDLLKYNIYEEQKCTK